MTAPETPQGYQTNPDHQLLSTAIATKVAMQIAEVLPRIQDHVYQGGACGGLTVRIAFRAGIAQGEGPIVAELEFATISGPTDAVNVTPNPATGQMSLMGEPGFQQATAITSYPSAQEKQPPPPLVAQPMGAVPTPREAAPLPPPLPGQVAPPVYAGLTGQIQPEQTQPATTMTPDQYAAWYAQQTGSVPQSPSAPQAAARPRPGRLKRPPTVGDSGIRDTQG